MYSLIDLTRLTGRWLRCSPSVFNHLEMGFVSLYQCRKAVLFLVGISFSISRFFLTLFSFIASPLFRFRGSGISLKNQSENVEALLEENYKEETNLEEKSDEKAETSDVGDSLEEKSKLSLNFKFPTFDEFIRSKKEKGELCDSDFVYFPDTSKSFEFTLGQRYRHFIKEQQAVNLDVRDSNGDSGDSMRFKTEENEYIKQVDGDSIKVLCDGEKTENSETADFTEETEEVREKEENFLGNQEISTLPEHEDSMVHIIDSHCGSFLSDRDFGVEIESDALDEESEDFHQEDSSNMDYIKIADSFWSNFLSEKDFHEDIGNVKIEDHVDNEKDDDKKGNHLCDSEESNSKDLRNFGNANKLESLWEHQELIEQLKMELRKVRATGLPTILEESESPKIKEDLKPWKIDEKFQHEGCMDELHRFYKSYTERMRKLDIFNYQKMYALGFLRLKDPFQSISRQRSSGQMFKSMFSENFRQLKHKVNESDPMEKFIKEVQSDVEVVYVGQMCLSWELLRWQYGKALDLWDSDPRGIHRYNEVAGEFQQFQVLMQRFIEDEPFQGPRVQYYIQSRFVNRRILQVPLIREESSGNRRNKRRSERSKYVITSDQLVEIIEESIRILWRFIRADKDTCSLASIGNRGSPTQLQNPGDLELLKEIRNVLQKNEKKLKELRSGNWILRRLRTCREEESHQVLHNFFSEVDMKLVCRVLNMSKIMSEQLLWCHAKLSGIYFENRRIHVDSSFLPFPC